jgi:hypothetical protein
LLSPRMPVCGDFAETLNLEAVEVGADEGASSDIESVTRPHGVGSRWNLVVEHLGV